MNPLVGDLGAAASQPSGITSATSTSAAAVLILIGLAVLQGLMAGYLARADRESYRVQLQALRDHLAPSVAALTVVFAAVLLRFAWRYIA